MVGVLQEGHGKRCADGYAACAARHPVAGGTGRRTAWLRDRASTQESGGGDHGLLRARDVSASLRRISNHCRSANGSRETRSCCRQGGCGNLARDCAAGRAVSVARRPSHSCASPPWQGSCCWASRFNAPHEAVADDSGRPPGRVPARRRFPDGSTRRHTSRAEPGSRSSS